MLFSLYFFRFLPLSHFSCHLVVVFYYYTITIYYSYIVYLILISLDNRFQFLHTRYTHKRRHNPVILFLPCFGLFLYLYIYIYDVVYNSWWFLLNSKWLFPVGDWCLLQAVLLWRSRRVSPPSLPSRPCITHKRWRCVSRLCHRTNHSMPYFEFISFFMIGTFLELTIICLVRSFLVYLSVLLAWSDLLCIWNRRLMKGCSSPMVVKFADTQKEKDQKRIHQATTNLWGGMGGIGINNLPPQYLTVLFNLSNNQPVQQEFNETLINCRDYHRMVAEICRNWADWTPSVSSNCWPLRPKIPSLRHKVFV